MDLAKTSNLLQKTMTKISLHCSTDADLWEWNWIKDKEIRKSEITFLGHKVTSEGLKIDPEKVNAILQMQMPMPENVEDVQRFCGFVNYLAKFLPKLSDVLEPVRNLTCADVIWNWTTVHDRAFKTVHKLVTEALVLVYYNPERELTIQCDASQNGLDARWSTHCVCQSCYDRHWNSICTDRKGDAGNCLLSREISSIHIW